MADTYLQGSFAFHCLPAEADLLEEALWALGELGCGETPAPPSDDFAAVFPPTKAQEPWSGLVARMPDPNVPTVNADFSRRTDRNDPTKTIVIFSSTIDFQPTEIAELIRACCQQSLALSPLGFEWAVSCSRARIDEFGGGWCAVFADRIEIENTRTGLSRALARNRPDDAHHPSLETG